MNAKEYLRQAWNIDQRIKDKLDQVARLKEMTTNVTSVISDMPGTLHQIPKRWRTLCFASPRWNRKLTPTSAGL